MPASEIRLGTARWSDPELFTRDHAFQTGQFWIGRSPIASNDQGVPDALGYLDDRHILLVSGTRSVSEQTEPPQCLPQRGSLRRAAGQA